MSFKFDSIYKPWNIRDLSLLLWTASNTNFCTQVETLGLSESPELSGSKTIDRLPHFVFSWKNMYFS